MILLLFFTLSGRIKHIELRTAGAAVCLCQTAGNRETGGNPVRSRHCKKGAHGLCQGQSLIQLELGRQPWVLIYESGNLPVVGTGIIFQITSNWLYRFTVFRPRISDSDGNGFLRRETVSWRRVIPSGHGYAAYYISAEKRISPGRLRNTLMRVWTAVWDLSDTGCIFLYLCLTDTVS